MKLERIDNGMAFDFGKTASSYAKYRNIYPPELYEKLHSYGVGGKYTKWLDIGTGTGVLPLNMFEHGAEIPGVDISAEQIEFAKLLAENKKAENVSFIVSPAENLPFADNSFDCITAAQCFWYFDRDRIIDEIKRIIKPGGIFVKIYMSYTLDDEIAKKSHMLVNSFNRSWTPGASGSRDMYNHPFDGGKLETFTCEISFTRETWHGRMCACRGTMASMDNNTLAEWKKAHLKMLSEYPNEFTVKHKVYIANYLL